jgi:hypothetical protein
MIAPTLALPVPVFCQTQTSPPIMNCCANNPSSLQRNGNYLRDKRRSQVLAYVAFVCSVIFTLAAASALVTSDLPLPLFG